MGNTFREVQCYKCGYIFMWQKDGIEYQSEYRLESTNELLGIGKRKYGEYKDKNNRVCFFLNIPGCFLSKMSYSSGFTMAPILIADKIHFSSTFR